MRAAIAGSTFRTLSAKIARPVALVLRRPSPPSGNATPSLEERALSAMSGE